MDDRFLTCLPYTLQQECNVYTGTSADWTNPRNFDDDPQDPGGATQCGLTHTDYDDYCEANGLPYGDVRHMGETIGKTIYYDSYWLPFCTKLPIGLDLFFFDTRVNMGTRRAVMLLQAGLDITSDGAWGPKTNLRVISMKLSEVASIIRDEEGFRASTYRTFRTFSRFGKDWLRRDQEIGDESIKMIGEVS